MRVWHHARTHVNVHTSECFTDPRRAGDNYSASVIRSNQRDSITK